MPVACVTRVDLHSLEETKPALCVLQNCVEKRLCHLGVIYADVFEWVEFQSGETHFVLQYHASDVNVSAGDLLSSILLF